MEDDDDGEGAVVRFFKVKDLGTFLRLTHKLERRTLRKSNFLNCCLVESLRGAPPAYYYLA